MAADQRKKRLTTASVTSFQEKGREKKKKFGLLHLENMKKKNSENMRKKEYISVIFKTSYLTRPNDTPYIGDITNIIITHYMPLTYYILPLSTTILLYTCHYLPPTPLSYSIHATNTTIIFYTYHYLPPTPLSYYMHEHNFQHSPSSWFEDIFHSQLASQLIKLLLV
ncbi:hypothetical protein CsSME_00004846 [Camellia sinensis var. sinensis]